MNSSAAKDEVKALRTPWPVKLVRIAVYIQCFLLVLSWILLMTSAMDIDAQNGLACDDTSSPFNQMRHGVLCYYLAAHFRDYMQESPAGTRIVGIPGHTRILFLISYEVMQSGLLYILVFMLGVWQGRIILYLIAAGVTTFYGISHLSISYSVVGIVPLLILLHKPSFAYLMPRRERD